ncbi:MAG: conjugal transfer protein TraO [Bacteroidota bacterium]
MSKRTIFHVILLALLMAFTTSVHAQRSISSLSLSPLYKVNGYGVGGSFNYYHSTSDYLQLSMIAAFSEEQPNSAVEFPFEDYLVNVGYFTTVLTSPRRGISIFFGGGPSVGYEIINDDIVEVSFGIQTPESTWVYGAFASFEMDFYLTDSLSLILPTTGMYHFNSEVEDVKLLLGLGIRFYPK